ncbi:epoxide hydrolase family protein [Sodalis sp. RH21]|uniref:epoxide hydrolase family protein n=1 Tax=unclassified Sodalis (in: enterobacteria) TaxID=2636512 RepID=UPI0039B6B187
MATERFKIDIAQSQLDDLHHRLENIRWPYRPVGAGWEKGVQADFIEALIEYWRNDFDWRTQETALNRFAHFHSEIAGYDIHFIHERGKGPSPIPLILTHGWPDSFTRYQKIIPYLTDPASYGGDPSDSFDVIIPSIPGFGFSTSPYTPGPDNAKVAGLWRTLMTDRLEYENFCAAGGDIGSGITRYLAAQYPEHLTAIHLTDVGIIRDLMVHKTPETLTEEEQAYRQSATRWLNQEGGYMSVQATKPATLAYGLNDSPAGLAAWITEKYRSWSDCGGDLFSRFSREEILTNISLYWLTGSIGTSINMYYENAHSLPPLQKTDVPVGIACFPADILPPPRNWVEKSYNIRRWRQLSSGGHFAAMEEPELYSQEIRAFFRPFRNHSKTS